MSLIRSLPRLPRPPYNRRRDLAKLLALWPGEIEDTSMSAHRKIVSRLHAALRHERRRGLAGHWDYDLSRHAALIVAFRAEASALRMALRPPQRSSLHRRVERHHSPRPLAKSAITLT